jgi:hypothetical protein
VKAAGSLTVFFLCLTAAGFSGQPKLVLSEISSYQPGDRIAPDTTVLDENLVPVQLLGQLEPNTEVFVLVIFGGGAAKIPAGPFRGPLWCQDSFDDLAIQRALVNSVGEDPVEVIGVAVPPVFAPEKYGYPADLFLTASDDSPAYQSALKAFVEKTVRIRESSLIPFSKLYFDPRMALLSKEGGEVSGNPGWLGRFKWHLDPRHYGAPTIWIFDRSGTVLREPFWGNEYGASPSDVRYGFQDLEAAVEVAIDTVP